MSILQKLFSLFEHYYNTSLHCMNILHTANKIKIISYIIIFLFKFTFKKILILPESFNENMYLENQEIFK